MQYGKYNHVIIARSKVNGVRKGVQQRSSDITAYRGELEWPLSNAVEGSIDLREESLRETGSFVLVPPRGIVEIGLREWPNDEPASHCGSVVAIELLAEPFLNDLPGVTRVGIGLEILQALVDDFVVPVWNRDGLRTRGDSVPQRLQVVDLLVDRQVVETGRRQRDWFGHEARPAGTIQFSIARVVRSLFGLRCAAPQLQPMAARPGNIAVDREILLNRVSSENSAVNWSAPQLNEQHGLGNGPQPGQLSQPGHP
jgi:hypothetical protein